MSGVAKNLNLYNGLGWLELAELDSNLSVSRGLGSNSSLLEIK